MKINWRPPPKDVSLSSNELDIWAGCLDQTSVNIAAYESMLSEQEKARALAFRFETDRNRFICSHGVLRSLLGRYLGLDPDRVLFSYSHRGKPELAGLSEADTLHFNMTHSEGLGLFAITRACAVGIDVERVRAVNDEQAIADRYFARRESQALNLLNDEQKLVAFYSLWTRKEAWLKATGEGICESLTSVEVSLLPDELARIISIGGNEIASNMWTLIDLSPAIDFKAAVAFPRKDLIVRTWACLE